MNDTVIMQKMTRTITILLFSILFFSCYHSKPEKDNYPRNKSISSATGVPIDSSTFYFPTSIQLDTNIINTGIDTFALNWFSSALFSAKEPILYNYYLGHDIYRFLWLRSFHRPVVISIHKDNDKFWLTTKELNKQPDFMIPRVINKKIKFIPPGSFSKGELDTTQLEETEKHNTESIINADRKAEIILIQTKNLSEKEWIDFEYLLNNCSFWTLKPCIVNNGLDGSEWIIEAHLKNKYWFVDRWSPQDNYRKAGEYLIKKCGLNERIY